jgi:hypothetical protein
MYMNHRVTADKIMTATDTGDKINIDLYINSSLFANYIYIRRMSSHLFVRMSSEPATTAACTQRQLARGTRHNTRAQNPYRYAIKRLYFTDNIYVCIHGSPQAAASC